MWLFYYFNFERNYDILKSESPCIFLNKNINFNKNEAESKTENPTVLERRILWFSSYMNHKLKVKLWWVAACERKKRAFFVPFVLSEGNFFKNCALLSQCIVYWIHFRNIQTFIFQKTLLFTLLLLVSKIVESLQFILSIRSVFNTIFNSMSLNVS